MFHIERSGNEGEGAIKTKGQICIVGEDKINEVN